MMDQVDLLDAFTSGAGFQSVMNSLLPALTNSNSAAAAVLALEGLFRVEADVRSGQLFASEDTKETIREFLRKWRCESPLDQAYTGAFKRAIIFLRSLTIFRTFDVPLFIDDYGQKRLMSDYSQLEIIPIDIDLDTRIVHVTHTIEKDQILTNQVLKPSDNKNIIEGIWLSPKNSRCGGMFGNWAFETTLRRLGVSGIRQGEIVSYKQEVNFIVYASDTVPLSFPPPTPGLPPPPPVPIRVMRATDKAVKLSQGHPEAYAAVSIFVPSKFLPPGVLGQAFKQPSPVAHGPFCVKEKRRVIPSCPELTFQ